MMSEDREILLSIDGRLSRMESRLDNLESRMTVLESRLNSLEGKQDITLWTVGIAFGAVAVIVAVTGIFTSRAGQS